ncbi:MAG TPA: penicillin-binding transpeptidase domain-containing protein [Bacillota bacterium]|nr:penicillin-binding transpeptidase domain-containing protein [Bacillota bacterium]
MEKSKTTQFMTAVLIVSFVCIFVGLSGRFLYIQATGTVDNVSLKEWAEEKRASRYELAASRGAIYDKEGITLAYDRRTYRLYAVIDEKQTVHKDNPRHVEDVDHTAEVLAQHIDADESYIRERLLNGIEKNLTQVEFGLAGKELTIEQKEEIEALRLPGINFFEEAVRHYPNGLFASHVLGFAREEYIEAEDKHQTTGMIGIERKYDEYLQGEPGYVIYQRDFFKSKLLEANENVKSSYDGNDIYLTIDQKMQVLLEDTMSEVEKKYSPESMSAIIMHAKTGEVLALSNRPSFDPNNPKDVQNWYNDVISSPFEPGSTMKMFTWAAAIDAGVYDGTEQFQSGKYQINPVVDPVHDHNQGRGWGKIPFDEGFRRSSNVAASMLVWEKLGPETYYEYLQAFDLDKPTNIDLPGEIPGQILFSWPREKLSTSFGQGSTLTPIQQVKAATAIVNSGEMLQPYVVKKIIDPETEEVIIENERTVVSQPISEEAANETLQLLGDVVNSDDGTGRPYRLDAYTVGGKTGTAQIPDPEGGYLKGRENNVFSFLGVAPLDDPALIMFVSVTKPELANDEVGSKPVSYIFKNVMENSLHYLNIEPDKEEQRDSIAVTIPSLNGQPKAVKEQLEKLGLTVTVIGSGENIVASNMQEGDKAFARQRIILVTDKPKMPNIIGWSLRDVYQLAELLELNIETIGNGYVITQSIKKGTKLKQDDYLGVEFNLPNEQTKEE